MALLRRVCLALSAECEDITVVGTLAMLEHLPAAEWSTLESVDVDLVLTSSSGDSSVEDAMYALGLRRTTGADGKWLSNDASDIVDLICSSRLPGRPARGCLEEPFAGVAFADRQPSKTIASLIRDTDKINIAVAGPLATLLGKALKVARYRSLEEWGTNEEMKLRASRSLRDILALLTYHPSCIHPDSVLSLAARTTPYGEPTLKSLWRSVRALRYQFSTLDSESFAIAGWSDHSPETRLSMVDSIARADEIASRLAGA